MDNEQLNEIGQMMDQRFESFGAALDQRIESALELFKVQIFQHIDKSETHVMDRIEAMEKRVIRQGGMLQGGSKTVYRLAEWSEDTDTELLRHAARIADLERQITELKRGQV
jgi:hypothetical protein